MKSGEAIARPFASVAHITVYNDSTEAILKGIAYLPFYPSSLSTRV
ncbi:MAG: hypothetical protein ACAF41_31430 [Leptolyngbya sp. BL-A-14]